MRKADQLLVDYFDSNQTDSGRPEAVKKLKQVIIKGVRVLSDMPIPESATRAKVIVHQTKQGDPGRVVEHVAASVQDVYKRRKGNFIDGIMLNEGKVFFLPDVEIPNDEVNQLKWRAFLSKLKPDSRTGHDPVTGIPDRIPYRDGIWMTDMAFRPGVPPELVDDISQVRGSLISMADHCLLDDGLVVQGDMAAQVDMLMNSISPIKSLGGNLLLFSEKRGQLKYAKNLVLAPQRLASWGLQTQRILTLDGHTAYRFDIRESDGERVYVLEHAGCVEQNGPAPADYFWGGQNWRMMENELPIEALNAVRHKLGKLRVYLGMGKDFIQDHVRFNKDNISKIIAFFDLCLGVFGRGRKTRLSGESQRLVTETANDLERISILLSVEGKVDELELDRRAGEIQELCETIDEERLRAIKKGLEVGLVPMDMSLVRRDQKYLRKITSHSATADDVFVTAGRTLVYLNNVLASKEAKSRAASMIKELRTILRGVESKKEADRDLLKILKCAGKSALKKVIAAHPDSQKRLAALTRKVKLLQAMKPSEVVKEFQYASYKTKSPALLKDKAFLMGILNQEAQGLDGMFLTPGNSGAHDMPRFKGMLKVNLVSYLLQDVKTEPHLFVDRTPTQVVEDLSARLEYMEPVIRVYNTVVDSINKAVK